KKDYIERVQRFEREVAADVTQLARVDVVLLQLLERRDVELPAERTLEIGELDHRQRRVGLADHVAGDVGELDVVVDWRRRDRRRRLARRAVDRAGEFLEQQADLAQLVEDLLVLLLQRLLRRERGAEQQH